MNNYIYGDHGGEITMAENRRKEIEYKFCKRLSEILCEIFEIEHAKRNMFSSLIVNSIYKEIHSTSRDRPGMLQQYINYKYDEAERDIKKRLLIPNDVKLTDQNGFSEFNPLIGYIKENFVRIEDIKSDGTFDTIEDASKKLTAHKDKLDGVVSEMINDGPSSGNGRIL